MICSDACLVRLTPGDVERCPRCGTWHAHGEGPITDARAAEIARTPLHPDVWADLELITAAFEHAAELMQTY